MNPPSLGEQTLSLRERHKLATRDAILDAAAAVLTSEGGSQVRMEAIASRAGVAVGTVYNYFTDRTALVNALLETRTQGLIDALDAPAPTLGDTPIERFEQELRHFVTAVTRYLDANRVFLTVLLEEEAERGIDKASACRRQTVRQQVLERAERLMTRGMKSKALRKADPVACAWLLLGMVRAVKTASFTDTGVRLGDSAELIVGVFLHGAAR